MGLLLKGGDYRGRADTLVFALRVFGDHAQVVAGLPTRANALQSFICGWHGRIACASVTVGVIALAVAIFDRQAHCQRVAQRGRYADLGNAPSIRLGGKAHFTTGGVANGWRF